MQSAGESQQLRQDESHLDAIKRLRYRVARQKRTAGEMVPLPKASEILPHNILG